MGEVRSTHGETTSAHEVFIGKCTPTWDYYVEMVLNSSGSLYQVLLRRIEENAMGMECRSNGGGSEFIHNFSMKM
jgi:hypothetical protein